MAKDFRKRLSQEIYFSKFSDHYNVVEKIRKGIIKLKEEIMYNNGKLLTFLTCIRK